MRVRASLHALHLTPADPIPRPPKTGSQLAALDEIVRERDALRAAMFSQDHWRTNPALAPLLEAASSLEAQAQEQGGYLSTYSKAGKSMRAADANLSAAEQVRGRGGVMAGIVMLCVSRWCPSSVRDRSAWPADGRAHTPRARARGR